MILLHFSSFVRYSSSDVKQCTNDDLKLFTFLSINDSNPIFDLSTTTQKACIKRAHKPFGKWMTFNVLLRHLWLLRVHCISKGRFACSSDADFSLLTLLAGRNLPPPPPCVFKRSRKLILLLLLEDSLWCILKLEFQTTNVLYKILQIQMYP